MDADGTHVNFGHVEECQAVDGFKVLMTKKRKTSWYVFHMIHLFLFSRRSEYICMRI